MTRKPLQVEGDQSVTFVELFFDLVFVFGITQLTVGLAADVSVGGVLRSVLLFWLIWWAWTQFTWSLNTADTTHDTVRLITLAATASAFVMAIGVPGAFGADGLLFALPYVVVRPTWLPQRWPDAARSGTCAPLTSRSGTACL